MQPPKLYDNKL